MADETLNTSLSGGPLLRSDLTLEELQVPFSMARDAAASQAWRTNPLPSATRWWELHEAEYNAIGKKAGDRGFLSAEEARQRAAERGLRLTIPDSGIDETVFNLLADRKQAEQYDQTVLQNYKGGPAAQAALFGVGLGVSMVDPVNLASAFVPVVGPARAAAFAGRFGVTGGRIATGAIEGAVGAAMLEPIVYGAASAEQADYTLADSALNVIGGTILGGGLHAGVGKVKDWWTGPSRPPLTTEQAEIVHNVAVMQAASGVRVDVTPIFDSWAPDVPTMRETLMGTVFSRPDTVGALRDVAVAKSLPVLDVGGIEQAARVARLAEIDAALAQFPAPDAMASDTLARVAAIEDQLRNPDLTKSERKPLLERRDELLTDTTPERLRETGAPQESVRLALTAERATLERQISEAVGAQLDAVLSPPIPGLERVPIRDPQGLDLYQRQYEEAAKKFAPEGKGVPLDVQQRLMARQLTDPTARDGYHAKALEQYDREVARLQALGDDPLADLAYVKTQIADLETGLPPEVVADARLFDAEIEAAKTQGSRAERIEMLFSVCGAKP